jgi:hypothetical protein
MARPAPSACSDHRAAGGFPFPHAVYANLALGGRIAGALSPTPSRGGCVMIEFILIVVVLLLLIGIFVRREVFKW